MSQPSQGRVCKVDGCQRKHEAKGWCAFHYAQFRTKKSCTLRGCSAPILARGLCVRHYRSFQAHGDPLAARPRGQRPRLCAVAGCTALVPSQLCSLHRRRLRRHGTTELITLSLAERFWAYVEPNGPVANSNLGPCWLWTGYTRSNGFGQIRVHDSLESAHILSWMLHYGVEKPRGLEIGHKCKVNSCVRPDHLILGSHRALHQSKSGN